MPLDFQKLPLAFSGGLDTKTDRKTVQAPKLLELQNGVFKNPGTISKRYGYDQLSLSIDGGDAIASGAALSTYQNELLQFSGTRVYSYLNATNKWADRGKVVSVVERTSPIIVNGYQQLNPDMAINSGFAVYAWEDSRNGVRYSVQDSETGAFLISDAQVSPDGASPKVVALANYILIFFTDGGSVKYRAINLAAPSLLAVEVAITINLSLTHSLYDVCHNGTRLYVSFANTSSGTSIVYIDEDLTLSASETATSGAPTDCLASWADSSENVWVAYCDGYHVQAYVRAFNLVLVLPLTTVETLSPSLDFQTITGIESSTGVSTIFYELTASNSVNHYVRSNTLSSAGVLGTASDFARSVGLASKPFVHDSTLYVNVAYESQLQSTYFTLDSSRNIVAKMSPGVAGGHRSNRTLPQVDSSQAGIFQFAGLQSGRLQSELNTFFSLLGVWSVKLDFANPNNFLTAEFGNSLYVVGGIVQSYDGVSFTEHNFHLYPDDAGISLAANSGDGYMGSGRYSYVLTYEWTDNNGRVQRSKTSEVQTHTFVSGSNNSIVLTIPTLRLTTKTNSRDEVRICVYRTEANLGTFYRVTSTIAPLFNDPTVDSVTFHDTLADDDLISRERVYTDGGVLDHAAPPAAKVLATYANRLWLGGLADPQTLSFSQVLIDGEPAEFSDELAVKCDPTGGPITGLAKLDPCLIVFKESAIMQLNGDGPEDTGEGLTYSFPTLITADVGCSTPNSIATTSQGIFFQSAKGIMLLDRSGSLSYVGASVERYNDLEITSTTVIPDQNIVVFTTADDVALVYDYFFQQWSTFTGHEAVDSLVWQNQYCFLKSNGRVYEQNKTKFTDGSNFVPLKLRTSFIALAGLQGYQRVRSAALLGEFRGPHTLIVQVAYDFNDNPIDQYSIDATTLFQSNVWGGGATWGSDEVWGGYYSPYHFILPALTHQKCQSVSFTIQDSQSSGYNEGYSITALTLEVGVKRGLNKTPLRNKFG